VNSKSKYLSIDSGLIKNDFVIFKGHFKDITYYSVEIGNNRNFMPFIIDTGSISISFTNDTLWKHAVVSNSLQNDYAKLLEESLDSILDKREQNVDSVIKYREMNISIIANDYENKVIKVDSSLATKFRSLALKYNESYYLFDEFSKYYNVSPVMRNSSKDIYNLFAKRIRLSDAGKALLNKIDYSTHSNIIGSVFFTQNLYDINKKKVNLQIQKEKITLVDFWASWCAPCIEKIPYFKNLHNKFQSKEFEIISISLDNNFQNWIAANKKYQIPWRSYCDINSFNSPDLFRYGIDAIPFTLLIDKKGIIVRINPSHEEIMNLIKSDK
jgi:thiol-disulfide isomerase/thioredoxin